MAWRNFLWAGSSGFWNFVSSFCQMGLQQEIILFGLQKVSQECLELTVGGLVACGGSCAYGSAGGWQW
jgi:hypothetical protein